MAAETAITGTTAVLSRLLRAALAAVFYSMFGVPVMSETLSAAGFADPAARSMAQAVQAGDVAGALAAARHAPGGVNAHGQNGETALVLAVDRFDVPMVQALLEADADPNGAPDRAPIHDAVKAFDLTVARMLLRSGASPDGRMGSEPALYEAALLGATDAAGLLLEAGAKIDIRDEIGNSACLIAAAADHWIMVDFLIGHGASIWITDTGGVTIGGLAEDSRLLPTSPEGKALDIVVTRLKAAGFPFPSPSARDIRTMVALKQWPPKP